MTAPSAPRRTKRELQSAITHVAYEAEGMRRAARAFAQNSRRFDLEAALTHVRNLIEFFWAPSGSMRPHPNGVYAVHYITRSRWQTLRAPCSVRPSQHYDVLCAQLSHISIRRSSRDVQVNFGKTLPVLVSDLETVWCVFTNELQATEWASRLNRAIARWHRAK